MFVISITNPKEMNREYWDKLYKFIFGNPEHKEWALSLYNAISGTNKICTGKDYAKYVETSDDYCIKRIFVKKKRI